MVLRFSGAHPGPVVDATLYGLTILAAAFLLAWAAEALQVDIAQGLAIALVALIAVLPEYAVDIAFALRAGQDPSQAPYAIANMTGANRLLVGIGWPVVFGLFWLKARRRVLELERGHSIEVAALAVATIFSFSILFSDGITLLHSIVLVAIFAGYVALIAKAPVEEPHLVGPAQTLGELPTTRRRTSIGLLILFAAAAVVITAEPFAESLIGAGVELGIDEFLLVQWVAPLASEAPEFLIASLPIAYGIGGGGWGGLPFDQRQWEELFITAAQSFLAVVLIARLHLEWWGAGTLLVLFLLQFLIPSAEVRIAIAWVYLGLGLLTVIIRRPLFLTLWRTTREVVAEYAVADRRSKR
jgi:cation:H+ antiporter